MHLGYLYGEYKKNYDKGIEHQERAIDIYNKIMMKGIDISYSYNLLATCWYMKKDYQKAKEYFLKAVELKPDYPLFISNLGLAYQQIGDKKNAEDCFLRAKALKQK